MCVCVLEAVCAGCWACPTWLRPELRPMCMYACTSSLSASAPCPPCLPPAAGEASAIFKRAEATARGVTELAEAVRATGGAEAVGLRVAEQYLEAFREVRLRLGARVVACQ